MKRLALALLLLGCPGPAAVDDAGTDSGPPPVDSGTPDSGAPDSGSPVDSGTPDAGFTPSPHRAFPIIPKGTGTVLSPLTLVTFVAANDPSGSSYAQFSDALIASNWYPAVTGEYGAVAPAASLHVTLPDITSDQSEQQIVDAISSTILDGGAPPPDGNTLYLVYLPAPYVVTNTLFCAYHKTWYQDGGTSMGDGWGVVAQCRVFKGGENAVDANTRVGSHEVVEAVTDSYKGYTFGTTATFPWTKTVWAAYEEVGHVEVGDLCEGTRITEGGWDYQRSWSNAHAAAGDDPCLPPNPGGYFSVSVPEDWYAADAGSTVQIPFTGWSTSARGPWLMNTTFNNGSPAMRDFATDAGFWTTTTSLGSIKLASSCYAYPGMNNGETGSLSVRVPAQAHSGDWITFYVSGFEEDPATCYPFPDRDDFHFWLVGVYVP
jgi:hypothetical protein